MSDDNDSIVGTVDRWAAQLAAHRSAAGCPDDDLLALIASCERLKNACAAVQASATHEYSERGLTGLTPGSAADQVARRDLGGRIGRARQMSPFHGSRHLALSRMLVRDLPHTLHALATGQTNEHRAGLIAHAAACLGTADRAALDADLGPRLTGQGDRAVRGEADRIAAELDADAVLERHRRAVADRRVTLRPAPDSMTSLTALLPVADGVATLAALDRHATLAAAAGDRRTRGQIMADELTRRLQYGPPIPFQDGTSTAGHADRATGPGTAVTAVGPGGARTPIAPDGNEVGAPLQPPVDPPPDCRVPSPAAGPRIPVAGHAGRPVPSGAATDPSTDADPPDRRPAGEPAGGGSSPPVPPVRQIDLMLVMTDRALLDGADTPAIIPGHGPVPAALTRGLLVAADPGTRVFLRRLCTDPTGNHLLSADARGRLFPHAVRQFVLARDQRCRTPFCDAPIRHIDHLVPYSTGGTTSLNNTGGLCARCNLTKAARTNRDVRPGPPPPPPRSAPWATAARNPDRAVASR